MVWLIFNLVLTVKGHMLYNVNNKNVEVYNLLACANHLHDRIISLNGEVCVHKTRLTPPLFIEVSIPSQEREWSCICV